MDKKAGTTSKTDYTKMAKDMIISGASSTYSFFRHPTLIPSKLKYGWEKVKEEAKHYYLGFKLLYADVKTAKDIMFRILKGHSMTRRERLQLQRTVTDLARLVPFSLFILIPFMELLLPVAIKMFPNMLPSTFEDSLKKEETMKNELNMRLSVASFFIDTIKTMAERKKKKTKGKKGDEPSEDNASATELIEFMEKARMGEPLPQEAVVRIARMFKDELTLANMPRPQLVTMCQFMNLPHFGSDSFLRFQLRTKLSSIKEDDKRILWEGVDSLSLEELKDACRERGMRASGLNTFGYRKQIKEWLDLSMMKHTPISLLIMSRAFVLNLSEENRQLRYEETLQTSISSMDEDVVNEIIVESASATEVNTAEFKKRKLESLQFQNEMIKEELEMEKEYKRKESEIKQKLAEESSHGDSSTEPVKVSVIGIGDRGRVLETNTSGGPSFADATSMPSVSFDKNFIRVAEGSKFDDVCDESEIPDQLHSKEKPEKKTTRLTAAEIQALGDMVLQSGVEREKDQLAKLKSLLKELPFEETAGGQSGKTHDIQQIAEKLPHDINLKPRSDSAYVDTEAVLKALENERDARQRKASASREVPQEVREEDLVYREPHREPPVTDSDGTSEEDKVDEEEDDESDVTLKRMKSLIDGMMTRLEDRVSKTESELGDKLHKLDADKDGMVSSDELHAAVMQVLRRHSKSDEAFSDEAAELIDLLDQDRDGRITVKELMEYVASRDVSTEEESKIYELQMKKDESSSKSISDDSTRLTGSKSREN